MQSEKLLKMTNQTLQRATGATWLLLVAVGCHDGRDEKTITPPPGTSAPAVGGSSGTSTVGKTPAALPSSPEQFTGTVVETMNSGGYTYVQVDTGGKAIWAAATEFEVAVGDVVVVPAGMAMPDFHSNTLNRDFELIYFTGDIRKVGAGNASALTLGQLPPGHPPLPGGGQPTQALPGGHPPLPPSGGAGGPATAHSRTHASGGGIAPGSIAKPAGGVTVAEIFDGKAGLAGKEVIVRGRVVKYTGGILGRNWLHVKDGTGGAGADDLTVTTTSQAAVGDTVVIKGRVAVDKDFGAGYRYAVLIEDAAVTVEQAAP